MGPDSVCAECQTVSLAGLLTYTRLPLSLPDIKTVALGYIGFGASAIGYNAFGSLSALGWESAISGGFSMAKNAAIAPIAFGAEVNTVKAAEIANLTLLNNSYPWILGTIAVLVIVPAIWHSKKVQQRMK